MSTGRTTVGPVVVAWADAATVVRADAVALDRIGARQARRYASLAGPTAARFLTGRLLMTALVAETTGREPVVITAVCERCGGEHGAPQVPDLPVSLSVSYAGSMVAAAAAPSNSAASIGIDLEAIAPGREGGPMRDLASLFAPSQPPDLGGWTMIEAALKADGRGLRVPPSQVRLGEPASVLLPGSCDVRVPGRRGRIEVVRATGPSGYVLSVAAVAAPAQ